MASQAPARGVKAGIKGDLQAAKDAGAGYVAGAGTTAWSHDFLNKKPWHPANFKNQMRKFEAEQEVVLRSKREEAAKAEFESEQRYLDTLAHLPSSEADKYRQRQSVSWMYLKPPGLSAWEEKAQKQKAEQNSTNAAPSASKPVYVSDACRPLASITPLDGATSSSRPFTGGSHEHQGWDLNMKRKERSPPIGGFDWADDNQQFVGLEEPADDLQYDSKHASKRKKVDKEHKKHKEKRHNSAKRHKKEKVAKETKDKERKADKQQLQEQALRRALKLLIREGIQVEDLVAPPGDDVK